MVFVQRTANIRMEVVNKIAIAVIEAEAIKRRTNLDLHSRRLRTFRDVANNVRLRQIFDPINLAHKKILLAATPANREPASYALLRSAR
jgi:hypothetical protein